MCTYARAAVEVSAEKGKQIGPYTVEDIMAVADANDKQRFSYRVNPETGVQEIRAVQGHTLKGVGTEIGTLLTPENSSHGTCRPA